MAHQEVCLERISGPHRGFYIASYACETAEPAREFLGYAKICRRRPDSYWDADCLVKLCGERSHAVAGDAVVDAEQRAREVLGDLVPLIRAAMA